MAPVIPDRWMEYTPVGKQIEGTRFICFKVPLRPSVIKTVEEKDRLDYDGLLDAIPNLGLIIDLTDTFRYYDPEVFESKGVKYVKIRIPGKIIPPKDLVDMFKKNVRDYLKKNANNDKLIGVHCTHGVNRTGFLVCNYMISAMSLDADEAIQKFGVARGHEIERQNYLAALQGINSHVIENYGRRMERKRNYPYDRTADTQIDNWRMKANYKPKHFTNYEDRWNSESSKPRRGHNLTSETHQFKRMRTSDYKSSYNNEYFNDNRNGYHNNSNSYRPRSNQHLQFSDSRPKQRYTEHRYEPKQRDNFYRDNREDKKWYKDDHRSDYRRNHNNPGSSSRSKFTYY